MTTEAPYEKRDDGIWCPRHKVLFASTESCRTCDAKPPKFDPGDIEEPLPAPPQGCRSSEDIETELVKVAKETLTVARSYARAKVRSRIGASSAAKLYEVYVKVTRLLLQAAHDREHEAIQRAREKRDRERGNRGGGRRKRGSPH